MNDHTVLDLSADEAFGFFMDEKAFSNLHLPPYFTFKDILEEAYKIIKNNLNQANPIKSFFKKNSSPKITGLSSHSVIVNKDANLAWRSISLHDPIIYVGLVSIITKPENWTKLCARFGELKHNSTIECCSLPVVPVSKKNNLQAAQISNWLSKIEQRSLILAMEYSHLCITDISNCYPSIYVHSISWALNGKNEAKSKIANNSKDKNELSSLIEEYIMYMTYGQTNGIPPGSALMDFIVELVFAYIDREYYLRLNEHCIDCQCRVLRYRDDYRIFSNNEHNCNIALKLLSDTLLEFGLHLNANKTIETTNLIRYSIKQDKFTVIVDGLKQDMHFALQNRDKILSAHAIRRYLIRVYDFADKHPNSLQTKGLLNFILSHMASITDEEMRDSCISLVVNLAVKNVSIFDSAMAFISSLIPNLTPTLYEDIASKILAKFHDIPNTDLLEVWLQRICPQKQKYTNFKAKLCHCVMFPDKLPWTFEWLKDGKSKQRILKKSIVDINDPSYKSTSIHESEIDIFSPFYKEYP